MILFPFPWGGEIKNVVIDKTTEVRTAGYGTNRKLYPGSVDFLIVLVCFSYGSQLEPLFLMGGHCSSEASEQTCGIEEQGPASPSEEMDAFRDQPGQSSFSCYANRMWMPWKARFSLLRVDAMSTVSWTCTTLWKAWATCTSSWWRSMKCRFTASIGPITSCWSCQAYSTMLELVSEATGEAESRFFSCLWGRQEDGSSSPHFFILPFLQGNQEVYMIFCPSSILSALQLCELGYAKRAFREQA